MLFNPDVTFDLGFPSKTNLNTNTNSTLNTIINRIRLDQEELNRQVFALLVLGTFIPPSFANSSSPELSLGAVNTGINSFSDFASSQINNWLSQLDTRFQLGVDYQTSYQKKAELNRFKNHFERNFRGIPLYKEAGCSNARLSEYLECLISTDGKDCKIYYTQMRIVD